MKKVLLAAVSARCSRPPGDGGARHHRRRGRPHPAGPGQPDRRLCARATGYRPRRAGGRGRGERRVRAGR